MQIKEVIQFVQDNDTFLISYYAKKHGEIITRRGTWTKPNTDTQGHDVFVYWDLDATPNQNGNKWRNATNPSVRVA